MDKVKRLELLRKRSEYMRVNRLEFYDPYPFQVKFHNDYSDRVCLSAGNQMGKTISGTAQDALDLTGLYPEWYKGIKFDRPIHIVCGGINNDKTRDILQKALLGSPVDRVKSFGSGWIPAKCLDASKVSLKRGVTDAIGHVMVRHYTDGMFDGWSQLTFSSYESGKEAWMGDTVDIYHGDEEPKMDILGQMGRGCIATKGRIRLTFTPENGETDVLRKVREQWSFHTATFADVAGEKCEYEFEGGEILSLNTVYTLKGKAGHIDKKTILNLEKDNPPWMMKTRMLGQPMVGEGLVFHYNEEMFKCEPIEFPDHFLFIDAIDFGGLSSTSHPTAFVRLAYDKTNDVIYIYDGFKLVGKEIPEVSAFINMKPNSDLIPVIWPHDGNKTLGMGGSTKEQYSSAGVNMAVDHFTNPPEENKIEGTGGIQIMSGITEMSARFNDGRLKVFNTCYEFFEEYRKYHMKDGKIVDRDDDFIAASRYGIMSIRHAVSLKQEKVIFNQHKSANLGWMRI